MLHKVSFFKEGFETPFVFDGITTVNFKGDGNTIQFLWENGSEAFFPREDMNFVLAVPTPPVVQNDAIIDVVAEDVVVEPTTPLARKTKKVKTDEL